MAHRMGMRWFSAVCGALALLAFYWLGSRLTNRRWAMLGWSILLVSPAVMYFSQEARSYIVAMLVSVLTMAVLLNLFDARRSSSGDWIAWTVLSIIGVYTAYSYLLVLSVQALCLLWIYRINRRLIASFCIAAVCFLPLLPWLLSNLTHDLQIASSMGFTFANLAQFFLAGDLARYGVVWDSTKIVLLFGLLFILGASAVFDRRDRFGAYLLLQLILPLGMYFVIGAPLFDWRMPVYQSRQFLVLLPPFVLLATLGLRWCHRSFPLWMGRALVGGISLLFFAAAFIGLERYGSGTKSPEGLAVQAVRQRLGIGEAVVSLDAYLNAAASFYLPRGFDVYTTPQQTESGYFFDDTLLVLQGPAEVHPRFSLRDVRAHRSVWILSRNTLSVTPVLVQGCQTAIRELFGPFEVLRVERCQD